MPSTRPVEIARRYVGVEVGAWARGVRARIPMSRQLLGRDVEFLSRPSEDEGGAVELLFRHLFLIEIPFAYDEEVPGGVVACSRVANEVGISELVDISIPIDTKVIGDINPALGVLVIVLVLTEPSRRVGVVTENNSGVVERHEVGGVGRATGSGRQGAPSFPAQHGS